MFHHSFLICPTCNHRHIDGDLDSCIAGLLNRIEDLEFDLTEAKEEIKRLNHLILTMEKDEF